MGAYDPLSFSTLASVRAVPIYQSHAQLAPQQQDKEVSSSQRTRTADTKYQAIERIVQPVAGQDVFYSDALRLLLRHVAAHDGPTLDVAEHFRAVALNRPTLISWRLVEAGLSIVPSMQHLRRGTIQEGTCTRTKRPGQPHRSHQMS